MSEFTHILAMLYREGPREMNDLDLPRPPSPELAQAHKLDYGRLFPSWSPVRDGENVYDLREDACEIDGELAEDLAGQAGGNYREGAPVEWDIRAWYQQIHFYGHDWGIFIAEDGLVECPPDRWFYTNPASEPATTVCQSDPSRSLRCVVPTREVPTPERVRSYSDGRN